MSNVAPVVRVRAPAPQTSARPLLSIDWSTVQLATEADALALWATIAPTGADWSERLDEVPEELATSLAVALLNEGNFACPASKPATQCPGPLLDLPEPAPSAGLNDPCLRRLLALWAMKQLDPDVHPRVLDALRAIVALPPPERELVSAALRSIPDDEPAKLEVVARAWNAGQREIANESLGGLDERSLIEAVTKHHIDGALERLSAKGQRATFLAAVGDVALPAPARIEAINELVDADAKLAPDLHAALINATAANDCGVAATAVHALERRGERTYLPTRPRTTKPELVIRALCVLASFERAQRTDQPSLLRTFVPTKGLERLLITYDPLSEDDPDGDGDPHTQHIAELIPRASLVNLVTPEIDDMYDAFRHCVGPICRSDQREYRFGFKMIGGDLVLYRLEIIVRPPCG